MLVPSILVAEYLSTRGERKSGLLEIRCSDVDFSH